MEKNQHMQELAAYRFTVDNLRARVVELEAQLAEATHPTQQGLDALHKQMLSALESVGSHTITDCDGDDVEVYFCNWEMVSAAKRAAQAANATT